jgi:cytochrome c551/c552
VKVTDEGDTVDKKNLFISTDFLQGNEDLAAEGHQHVPDAILGKSLMLSSDCKGCHKIEEKSIGPSFTTVATRYQDSGRASTYLMEKIIKGGVGRWGENAMPAHPTMKPSDVKQITTFILSLASKAKTKSMPPAGTVNPVPPVAQKQNTMFSLTASYTDLGSGGVKPLTGSQTVFLRNNSLDASELKSITGFTTKDSSGNIFLIFPQTEGSLRVRQIDLTGIKSIELQGFSSGQPGSYRVEIRTGAPNGNMLGQGVLAFGANKQKVTMAIPIEGTAGGNLSDVFIVFKADGAVRPGALLKTIRFKP